MNMSAQEHTAGEAKETDLLDLTQQVTEQLEPQSLISAALRFQELMLLYDSGIREMMT